MRTLQQDYRQIRAVTFRWMDKRGTEAAEENPNSLTADQLPILKVCV